MTRSAAKLSLVGSEPPPKPKRKNRRKWKLRHVVQRVDERTYPGGHVWRQNRAHIEAVLRARVALCVGEVVDPSHG